MPVTQVWMHFGEVMCDVVSTGEPVIAERAGKPVVTVISTADLKRLQELRSTDISPAIQATLDRMEEWRKIPDPAGPECWEEFEREW